MSGHHERYILASECALCRKSIEKRITALEADKQYFQSLKVKLYRREKTLTALEGKLEKYETALNKLARLGNGKLLGNSVGNMIAREAILEKVDKPTPRELAKARFDSAVIITKQEKES